MIATLLAIIHLIENLEKTPCTPFYLIFTPYLSYRQMLENGFFHADPHAGNLLAMPSGIACIHTKAHRHTIFAKISVINAFPIVLFSFKCFFFFSAFLCIKS